MSSGQLPQRLQWRSASRITALVPERWRFMTPALLAMVFVLLLPLLYALYLSFQHNVLTEPLDRGFDGTANYGAFLHDDRFWTAARNTGILALGATSLEFILGFMIALSLAKPGLRGRNMYLSILLVPMLMPYIAGGLIWLLMLHPTLGIVNYSISETGLSPPAWLSSPDLARTTIILVDAWHNTSWMTLILFAGLVSLPEEPYSAAKVDGAGPIRSFVHVTLPLMRPTILTALIVKLIASLLTYDLIYVMTQGGPGRATETLSYYIYRVAFQDLDLGKAAAAAYTFLLLICTIILVLIRVLPHPTSEPARRRA
jgi:multiple sugar transport system permease protein